MWWVLAPLGLDEILLSLRKRNWGDDRTRVIFQSSLVMIAIILTVFVVNLRLFTLGWGEDEIDYPAVEEFLLKNGVEAGDIVIVRNAPGYYVATERSAISIPYGGANAILAAADQFGANYLVLESKAAISLIESNPQNDNRFMLLGEVNDASIIKIDN